MNVSPEDIGEIRRIVWQRKPLLAGGLGELGHTRLDEAAREEIREVLAEELGDSGLDLTDEPNARGLQLERLIDVLGRL